MPSQRFPGNCHFQTQKNGEHGETRIFTRNAARPTICPVTAWLQIFQRFHTLRGLSPHIPLCVYLPPGLGKVQFITARDIEAVLRSTAAAVYNLDPVKNSKDLQKWSSHSVRVGACVILHANGFSDTQIKYLLRWRSDAFMVYLRNLGALTYQQNIAFAKTGEMPHFI